MKQKTTWADVYLNGFKQYRKWRKGNWYKHQNTYQLSGLIFNYFWARYGELNRYTKVIKTEEYGNTNYI